MSSTVINENASMADACLHWLFLLPERLGTTIAAENGQIEMVMLVTEDGEVEMSPRDATKACQVTRT